MSSYEQPAMSGVRSAGLDRPAGVSIKSRDPYDSELGGLVSLQPPKDNVRANRSFGGHVLRVRLV